MCKAAGTIVSLFLAGKSGIKLFQKTKTNIMFKVHLMPNDVKLDTFKNWPVGYSCLKKADEYRYITGI